jgi:hypothetical protein
MIIHGRFSNVSRCKFSFTTFMLQFEQLKTVACKIVLYYLRFGARLIIEVRVFS